MSNTGSAGDIRGMIFTTNSEDRARFTKAVAWEVKNFVSAYEIVTAFHSAGIFLIKVSVFGPNLCLLEELV